MCIRRYDMSNDHFRHFGVLPTKLGYLSVIVRKGCMSQQTPGRTCANLFLKQHNLREVSRKYRPRVDLRKKDMKQSLGQNSPVRDKVATCKSATYTIVRKL